MRKLFMYFTELEAEFILRFKFKKIIQQIKNGSIDKYTVKKLAINYYLDYLARLVRGKCITFTEACDLLDEASQKIQAL